VVLQQTSANPALLKAIQGIKHIVPDQALKKQLDDICTKNTQAITTTDAPHNKKGNNIARKQQQQLINKAPKESHKEFLKIEMHSHGQASKLWKTLKQAKLKLSPPNKPRYLKSTLNTPGKLSTLNTAPTSLKKHLETTHGNTQRTSQEINLQTPLSYN